MDRFIEKQVQDRQKQQEDLKSNMDRFIAYVIIYPFKYFSIFKIQYG